MSRTELCLLQGARAGELRVPPICLFATPHLRAWTPEKPAGLSWLVSQMQRWPERYKDACWVAWQKLLLPPLAGRRAAVD